MGKRTTKNQRTKDNTIENIGLITPKSEYSPLRRKKLAQLNQIIN